jgi:predicted peptidase
MKLQALAILFFFSFLQSSKSQDLSFFERQLFILNEDTLPCRILTPINYQAGKKYPLVVFLHGAGERGSDNEAQLKWGAELFLDSANRAKYPAIVIFPQCPTNDKWAEYNKTSSSDSTGYSYSSDAPIRKSLNLVSSFIDTLLKSGQIDIQRVYLGGLSMGGFGTYELLWRKPNTFAAALPICGAGNPAKIKTIRKNLPVWIFHGDKDNVIPVANSRLIYGLLKNNNPKIKYTEYPEVGHDSWKNAFAEPRLMEWLFAQKLTKGKTN